MATTSKLLRKEMMVVLVAILFMDTFSVSAQNPLVSFRARKHNDTIISSNFFLGDVATVNNVSPGDTIEIDMYLSGWGDVGDGTLRAWQITIDFNSLVHNAYTGCYLKPLGYDAPLIRQKCDLVSQCSAASKNAGSSCCSNDDCEGGVCEASPDCLDEDYPICNQCPVQAVTKRCTGLNFDPSLGAFIKRKLCSIESDNAGDLCFMDDDCSSGTCIDNENFIFHGIPPVIDVPSAQVDYRNYSYSGFSFSSCIEDTGERRYAGTLILEAGSGATGTFRIVAKVLEQGQTGISPTFVESCDGLPVEASSSALTVNMNSPLDCHVDNFCSIVYSDPPNCAIDARYPWPSDDFANKLGWNSIDIRVAGECPTVMTTDDFAIRFEGGVGFPSITGVTDLGNQTYRVSFSPRLRPNIWACVDFLAANPIQTKCIGAMPADVNADRISNADDVQAMIDHLNSPSLSIWQCDADRSGSCQPADVPGVIDMLNGADAFPGWHGDSIIACPSWP